MDNPPRRMHAPLERQRSENNHIRDGRWPLRIAALTAAVALILVLMFNFMAPKGRLDAPSATGTPATEPMTPATPAAPSVTPPQADPATAPAGSVPR
ncbi:hypothetical protein WKI45_02795 [Delftia tsuruhatensis]